MLYLSAKRKNGQTKIGKITKVVTRATKATIMAVISSIMLIKAILTATVRMTPDAIIATA